VAEVPVGDARDRKHGKHGVIVAAEQIDGSVARPAPHPLGRMTAPNARDGRRLASTRVYRTR
jgi:hypothetical protein